MYLYVCKTMHVCNCVCMNMYACMHSSSSTSLPVSTPNIIHHRRLTVFPSDSLGLTRCYRFCFGLAPVNKLVPATLLFWALWKSRVYDYDYDHVWTYVCTRIHL